MKIKLDENIGRRGLDLLKAAGHDVMTVRDQNLLGTNDENLFNVCAGEDRVLITLDHDFGQILRFPSGHGPGVVILEPGPRVTPGALLARIRDFLTLAAITTPSRSLWIIEPGRVRVRSPDEDPTP